MNEIEANVPALGMETETNEKLISQSRSTSNILSRLIRKDASLADRTKSNSNTDTQSPGTETSESEISEGKSPLFNNDSESVTLAHIVTAATIIGSKVAAAEWWLGGNLSQQHLVQFFITGLDAACNGSGLPSPDGQQPVAMCALAGGHLLGRHSRKNGFKITDVVKQKMVSNFQEGLRRRQNSARKAPFVE